MVRQGNGKEPKIVERLIFDGLCYFFGIGIILILIIALMPPKEAFNFEPHTHDITGTHVIVNWYETETELQTALDDFELAGLSECEFRPEFNTSFCELWLVRPTNDYDFDTIGHEFYHTVAGDWHD